MKIQIRKFLPSASLALVSLVSVLVLEACTTVVVRRPPGYYGYQRCRANHPYRPWLCR